MSESHASVSTAPKKVINIAQYNAAPTDTCNADTPAHLHTAQAQAQAQPRLLPLARPSRARNPASI